MWNAGTWLIGWWNHRDGGAAYGSSVSSGRPSLPRPSSGRAHLRLVWSQTQSQNSHPGDQRRAHVSAQMRRDAGRVRSFADRREDCTRHRRIAVRATHHTAGSDLSVIKRAGWWMAFHLRNFFSRLMRGFALAPVRLGRVPKSARADRRESVTHPCSRERHLRLVKSDLSLNNAMTKIS